MEIGIAFLLFACGIATMLYVAIRPGSIVRNPFIHEAFVAWMGVYAAGAVYTAFQQSDNTYAQVVAIASATVFISALLTSFLMLVLLKSEMKSGFFQGIDAQANVNECRHSLGTTYLLLSSSTLVCVAFCIVVLSNVGLSGLLFQAFIGESSFLDLRKAITFGSEVYVAPGVVKQFRDIILPAAMLAIVVYAHRPYWSVLSIGVASAILAALLAGQRSSVVIILVILAVGLFIRGRMNGRIDSRLIGIGVIGACIVLYTGLTIILGRIDSDMGVSEMLYTGLSNILERVIVTPPSENIHSAPIWMPLAPAYGTNWAADLLSIGPGDALPFSTELHVQLGGSAQGHSPLGMPADAYLAWGWAGVVIVPSISAALLAFLDRSIRRSRSPFGAGYRVVALFSAMAWHSPFLFLLNGGAVGILLGLWASTRPILRIRPAST